MKNISSQHGVGLVEVLVALLILSVGVLGFVALQYRALEATAESGSRVQAIAIARDLSEKIRANRNVFNNYRTEIQTPTNQKTFAVDCRTTNCTEKNLADYDVAQVTQRAATLGMSMNIMACPETTSSLQCIYVAWGDTSATNSNGEWACTNGAAYNPNSTCIIMEAY